ncbi:MAG: PIN domain-containing protein [Acidobacteria bacterium]|nr:PIN domain-containing protein [Acidobacteriota bacterium]
MSVEFVDTNVLLYAQEIGAGRKHDKAQELLIRLFAGRTGALSTQVLTEFYAAATKKLLMTSLEAEGVIEDLGHWRIHRPEVADLIRAAHLQRRYRISWWDALIVNSASQLECRILWSEDFNDGQRYGSLTVRNPFG